MSSLPTLQDIKEAHARIKSQIHRTPVLTSQSLNQILGAEFFFKCENFQKVGAFKFRGASNSVLSLSEADAMKGVGTHSSGNHAAALALAARNRGIPSYIVMPDNSPEIKKKAVAGYGAQITYCEPTQESRETTMAKVQKETGCTFIHPFNRFEVLAGQGTASLEFMDEVPDLDLIMTPVGGGGLFSGTSIAVKSINDNIRVWAGEPEVADDAFRSLQTGVLQPPPGKQTIADGLRTSLGPMTFEAIQTYADEIRLCSEQGIIKAMQMIWERMKIIVEPSSAVPLAALIENKPDWKGWKIGIILTGGNVQLNSLPFE